MKNEEKKAKKTDERRKIQEKGEREMKEKKRYYSPVKEYDSYKRPHPFFKIIKGTVKLFFPKTEMIFTDEKPQEGESVVYVSNHTKLFAPAFFILNKKLKARVWQNCYFLYFNMCWDHMKNKVLKNRKPKFLLYPLAYLLTPFIVLFSRAYNPVPVFHTGRELFEITFKKSSETLNEGLPLVIFPERTENKVNRYIYQLNTGFPRFAEVYYKETGKIVRFYPVYCAQKLRKVVVGKPVSYDPTVPMAKQKTTITRYLESQIETLGDSLPPHEPVIYG